MGCDESQGLLTLMALILLLQRREPKERTMEEKRRMREEGEMEKRERRCDQTAGEIGRCYDNDDGDGNKEERKRNGTWLLGRLGCGEEEEARPRHEGFHWLKGDWIRAVGYWV